MGSNRHAAKSAANGDWQGRLVAEMARQAPRCTTGTWSGKGWPARLAHRDVAHVARGWTSQTANGEGDSLNLHFEVLCPRPPLCNETWLLRGRGEEYMITARVVLTQPLKIER